MSAIAGIFHMNGEPVSVEHSNGMMKSLEKYPADDVQTWHNGNIFLGCHAQWITPESVGEKLPYYDHERKLAITADAIIDNRDELFDKLNIDAGKRQTMTDSELILLAYAKWGEDSPKHLVGDFAYMIWDERERKLFGARDFSGSRTLYYYSDGKRFAFCTVIHPFFTLPYINKELNEEWLAEFLAISNTIDTVDARTSPYRNIEQLPPFHTISLSFGKVGLTRYGSLVPERKIKLKSDKEYVEAFKEIFQKAVSERLRTHRNVGSQLSGGLDSGAVVGFAGKELKKRNKPLHTFSYIPPHDFIDFTPKNLLADERPFITSTVEYVGGIKDHYLDFEGKNSYTDIDSMIDSMEMPYKFFESSFWLKGMFEEASRENVGVLLNGDSGNFTVSWGSKFDYYAMLLKKLKWFNLFYELNQYSKQINGNRLRNLPIIFRVGFPTLDKILAKDKPFRIPGLINMEFAERTKVYSKLREYGIGTTGWLSTDNIYEERVHLLDKIFLWNTGNILYSKLSLKYKIWKRDPTNDLRISKFCLSIPENQYVQNGFDRSLIRRATENYLPDKVRLNQRFRGVQGVDWVHRMIPFWGNFLKELQELCKDDLALQFLDEQTIKMAIPKVIKSNQPEYAIDQDFKVLMRSIIAYRFIKSFS